MRIVLFFSILMLTASAFSQNSKPLTGKVFEITSNKDTSALPGVNLVWLGTTVGTSTDASGKFSIKKVPGVNKLLISSVGYEMDTLTIDSMKVEVSIYLSMIKTLMEIEVIYRENTTQISFMNPIKTELITERELRKAACCNLSESFETNPSVDVNFTDAVSGTKQIQMLGLSGQYALVTKENMPYLRGLASGQGLTFIPGTWIQSIQLGKGAGTVVNGYESFTGQINTELKKPNDSEKLFFNAYANENARNEYNLNLAKKLNDSWSTGLLIHSAFNPLKQDHNHDHFLDVPTGKQINVESKWAYFPKSIFEWQFGGNYLSSNKIGGDINYNPKLIADSNAYGIQLNTERYEVYSKSGIVFKKPETSVGLQLSFASHHLENRYGLNKYKAWQETGYANLIFQSILYNTNHKYKVGLSYLYDRYDEKYKLFKFIRTDQVPGAFAEYTYSHKTNFNLVAGIRADYHNYYGLFYTPRLHMRYAANESKSVFRISAGRALKTANILSENTNLMASSREFEIIPSDFSMPYGLQAEVAWNYGFNFTQKLKLNYRDAYFTMDLYRTDFENQVVIDVDHNTQKVLFYNLQGKSFSNSAQAEFGWEIRKRLDMKLAYRFVESKTTFTSGLRQKPFVSMHRAFINLSYQTKNQKWQFDVTTQWHGSKRVPDTYSNPASYQISSSSPEFYIVNAQVQRTFKKEKFELEIYLGVENATDVKQQHPIISNHNPFGSYFDASLVWGPIFGRMSYGGIRFKIK